MRAQVQLPDGTVIEGSEAQKIIKWLKEEERKKEEKERKKRERVIKNALKKLKKPKAQVFQMVCENNHIFTVPAHEINDPCGICGGIMKLHLSTHSNGQGCA